MTEVYTGPCSQSRTVSLSLIIKLFRQQIALKLLRRKHFGLVSSIGERRSDAPSHIGLPHVGNGLVFQRVPLMKQEAALKIGKLLKLLTAVGQCCPSRFDVLFSAAYPCALGRSQNVCINIILSYDIGFSSRFGVVPCSRDGSGHIGIALLLIIYVTFINAHQIGINVKMVCIIVTTVNIGQTCHFLAGSSPHLCHVSHSRCRRTGHQTVPHHHSAPFAANVTSHCFQKIGISYSDLVTSYMNIGSIRKSLHHFVQDFLQRLYPLVGLHAEAHGFGKDIAVSRHIYFRNYRHPALRRIGLELAALFLCVVLSGIAYHIFIGCQLRIGLHFKAPCQFFRKMPVKYVHFETCQKVYLLLQFVKRHKGASHIVHETSQLESRPVGHRQGFKRGHSAVIAFGQLRQCLCGTDDTGRRNGLYCHGIGRNVQRIRLIGKIRQHIIMGAVDPPNQFHRHSGCGPGLQGTAVSCKEHAQSRTGRRVADAYGTAKRKRRLPGGRHQQVRTGQQVYDFGLDG